MAISNELRKLVDPNNECCCEHCLSNKCKEWALSKNNLELISAITEDGAYCQIDNMVPSTIEYDINQMDTSCRIVFNSIIFDAGTEPEAIFKATSYIMETTIV